MFGLRADHEEDEYGDCLLCSSWPAWSRGQRGCPTTGLPAAPLWRPRSVEGAATAGLVERARWAVTDLRDRVGHVVVAEPGAGEVSWCERLARWHAQDQAADLGQHADAADRSGL